MARKHQRRVEGFDERILALYSRGMSVRETRDFVEEADGADVSKTLISEVRQGATQDVDAWRGRSLDPVYPIVSLDGIVVKVGVDVVVDSRTVCIALGVNLEDKQEVPGLHMAGSEGAELGLWVITGLENRRAEDILIACCDGLKGSAEAVEAVFLHTIVQTWQPPRSNSTRHHRHPQPPSPHCTTRAHPLRTHAAHPHSTRAIPCGHTPEIP